MLKKTIIVAVFSGSVSCSLNAMKTNNNPNDYSYDYETSSEENETSTSGTNLKVNVSPYLLRSYNHKVETKNEDSSLEDPSTINVITTSLELLELYYKWWNNHSSKNKKNKYQGNNIQNEEDNDVIELLPTYWGITPIDRK